MTSAVLQSLRQRFSTIFSLLALMLITTGFAFGQREKVLYSFGVNGVGGGDGDYPQSSLTADTYGNLYGTTYYGGTYSLGTVFELSPPAQKGGVWTETILHSFQGGVDGELPASAGILDKSGNIYGATTAGGVNGLGVVYELSPPPRPVGHGLNL